MTNEAIREFRIGEGGIFRRFETAAHLTRLAPQIACALALTWLPVMVLSLVSERMTGRRDPLVHAAGFHVRLLVAVPVLLALDQVFPRVCRSVLTQLVTQSFVPEAAEARLDRALQSGTRLADSPAPELILAALALALGLSELAGVASLFGRPGEWERTVPHVWYAAVDLPLVQFLIWRSLWRWVIWVRMLIGLAGIELDLVPSHPDRRGGINFLRWPSIGYCSMLVFAISSIVCANQVTRFTAAGMTLRTFAPLLLAFAATGTLIAFGPLLLFTPRLIKARRIGLIEYGRLGAEYGRGFQKRWFSEARPGAGIGPRSTQPLSDLAVTYRDTIDRFRILLFGKRDLITLLLATLLPMVPVMLMRVPPEDWRTLLKMLG
ncbi:MAG TPA: hypothetical protein VGH56_12520, partial [Solirubrobacteraceae bacterium]